MWSNQAPVSDRTILAGDIGAIGYYSHAQILDEAGLVWPEALKSSGTENLVRRYRPDYLLINVTRWQMRMMRETEYLRSNYSPIRRFSPSGTAELRPKPDTLENTWRADYVLYARSDLAERQ